MSKHTDTSKDYFTRYSLAAAELAEMTKVCDTRARQIKAMTEWLDQNQPDVWRRGLFKAHYDAITAQSHPSEPACATCGCTPWEQQQRIHCRSEVTQHPECPHSKLPEKQQ